jgi:DNA-binding PucR family transcriptional regulator
VFDPTREAELQAFLADNIGALLEYDEGGRADLVGTLRTYFRMGGNLTRSARALHIHMNTLLKRIDRISSLIGDDWREPDRALQLHLALRLSELAQELGP